MSLKICSGALNGKDLNTSSPKQSTTHKKVNKV